MLLQHLDESDQIVHPRLPNLASDQRGRDIHTVQNVADVVQDSGGDLRHARLARKFEEFILRQFPGGDVQVRPGDAQRGAVGRSGHHSAASPDPPPAAILGSHAKLRFIARAVALHVRVQFIQGGREIVRVHQAFKILRGWADLRRGIT